MAVHAGLGRRNIPSPEAPLTCGNTGTATQNLHVVFVAERNRLVRPAGLAASPTASAAFVQRSSRARSQSGPLNQACPGHRSNTPSSAASSSASPFTLRLASGAHHLRRWSSPSSTSSSTGMGRGHHPSPPARILRSTLTVVFRRRVLASINASSHREAVENGAEAPRPQQILDCPNAQLRGAGPARKAIALRDLAAKTLRRHRPHRSPHPSHVRPGHQVEHLTQVAASASGRYAVPHFPPGSRPDVLPTGDYSVRVRLRAPSAAPATCR